MNPAATEVCDSIDNNCDGTIDEGFDGDGDGVTSCGGDCDDSDASVFPGQSEICGNNVDDDCDGQVDVNTDDDGDGVSTCDGDCDDTEPTVFPSATEICDGVDNNCDGAIDEGFDGDGDGSASCLDCDDADPAVFPGAIEVCDGADNDCDALVDELSDVDADGVTTCAGDCDDANASVNPLATEVCNLVDDNCDGAVDEGFDADGDGSFDGADAGCAATYGGAVDCDDSDPLVFGGAPELCDGVDNDCEGSIPDGELDGDGDGYVGCPAPEPNHVDAPTGGGDCDDGNPAINPGATELCNGLDDDCSGLADEAWDLDEDGFADGDALACQSGDFVGATDCDDGEPAVFPGAAETCNALDDNCDGRSDEDFDLDGDGWFDGTNPACASAWAALGVALDCDDTDDTVFPFNVEDCLNGVDDNCEGQIDEDEDLDGDGLSTCDGDCDDDDPTVYRNAPETCNGRDDDCDFVADEDFDGDGDGTFAGAGCLVAWGEEDCDDLDPAVFPGAAELCNDLDDDCDGPVDEPFDLDDDGFWKLTEDCGATYGLLSLDCDDNEPTANPDAPEICDDGIDNDCDQSIDGDDPDCAGDDDDATSDDDDATSDDDDTADDDATSDDDDTADDDDSATTAPWVYPGCACSAGDQGSGSLLLIVPLLFLRRRRSSRLPLALVALLLVGVLPATAWAQAARTVVVLTTQPEKRGKSLGKLIPEGFGASLVDVTGEQNVAGVWVLGTTPERVCPQTSGPPEAVKRALERAQTAIDELAVEEAETQLSGVRQTLACLQGKLDPSELWRLYFLEGVAAFYRQGLPASRASLARALAVLPGQYFDSSYSPDLEELYLELQKGALEGGRAKVVAGTEGGDEPGAVFVDGFPVAGPGLAVVPGEHILQVRLPSGSLVGAVVRLIEDDVVAVGLPLDVAKAGGRLDLELQRVLAGWVKRWAGVQEGRVWIRSGDSEVFRLGETDADRIELAEVASKPQAKGIQLTPPQRNPLLLLNVGGGYQFVGRGNYGGGAAELSVRIKGPLRIALGTRVMFSQPVIDPSTGDSLGIVALVPVLLGPQLRFTSPFVQLVGLHFQVGPNPSGTEGGPVLPGAALQLGAEFPLGASRLLIRPSVEVGNLGKFFTFRGLVSLGLAIGPG